MVVDLGPGKLKGPLGPGKFYGSSLPRPRYYTSEKPNWERIDPPTSVLDPFLSWANDAHWSMGGLSFKRQRLQGKIEGNISKLRSQMEDDIYNKTSNKTIDPHRKSSPSKKFSILRDDPEEEEEAVEEEEEEEETHVAPLPRKRARKLIDEFNKVGSSPPSQKASEAVASKKQREIVVENVASRTRSSRTLDRGKEKEEERRPKGRKRLTKAKKSS